jgi:hypothetical protein
MFKYDKYITNSLIITKYINKTYQHKNKWFDLMAIGLKANKLSILYIVNKRHDKTEHKNQQL